MQITIELPDDLMQHPNAGREALEAFVIESYRAEALSHHQAAQLLSMGRFEFEGFLKDREIFDHAYAMEDLERDIETIKKLNTQRLIHK